jgi:hypothetical protein
MPRRTPNETKNANEATNRRSRLPSAKWKLQRLFMRAGDTSISVTQAAMGIDIANSHAIVGARATVERKFGIVQGYPKP